MDKLLIEETLRSCFFPNQSIIEKEWNEQDLKAFMIDNDFIFDDENKTILYDNSIVLKYKSIDQHWYIGGDTYLEEYKSFKDILIIACFYTNIITNRENYYFAEYSTDCDYHVNTMTWKEFKRPYLYPSYPYKLIVDRRCMSYNQKNLLINWCKDNIGNIQYHHAIWCFESESDQSMFLLRWQNVTNIS